MENKDFRMVAKTMFGLEDVLVKELEALGAKNIETRQRLEGNVARRDGQILERSQAIGERRKTEISISFVRRKPSTKAGAVTPTILCR